MFGFGKKKEPKVKPLETEESNDKKDDFDGDTSNDVKVLRKEEPSWRGLKRKYIYYVVGVVCLITLYAVFSGLEDDKKRAQEAEQRKITEVRDSKAVSGDHLLNIPKDYKEQAEREAKKKRDEERMKAMMETEDRGDKDKEAKAAEAPVAPQVPPQPYVRHELTPAEKAELKRLEIKMKALESPIGFELKEEDRK